LTSERQPLISLSSYPRGEALHQLVDLRITQDCHMLGRRLEERVLRRRNLWLAGERLSNSAEDHRQERRLASRSEMTRRVRSGVVTLCQ
jgi:hypothetical protein